jgi:hypothetical protein
MYGLQFFDGLFLANDQTTRAHVCQECWFSNDEDHATWYCNYKRSKGLDVYLVEYETDSNGLPQSLAEAYQN